jgi:uncharacterized membrane protein YesL
MRIGFPASLRVIGRSIVDWWDGWMDMVLVTAVWFFAQLTIVLGPPATFGAYYVVYNMVNGEALGVRGLIEGAKKYFWKSLLWGLLNLFVLITVGVNFQFYGSIDAIWGFYLQVFIAMLGVFWLATNFYALPYFMEQDVKKLRIALKNGMLTTLAAPFFTIVLMIMGAIVLLLSFGFVIPLFLGLPGLIPMMGYRAMYDRLVAFGIRQKEKTPKEIEYEAGGRINVPTLDDVAGDGPDGTSGGEIAQREGQVKQEEQNEADRL